MFPSLWVRWTIIKRSPMAPSSNWLVGKHSVRDFTDSAKNVLKHFHIGQLIQAFKYGQCCMQYMMFDQIKDTTSYDVAKWMGNYKIA